MLMLMSRIVVVTISIQGVNAIKQYSPNFVFFLKKLFEIYCIYYYYLWCIENFETYKHFIKHAKKQHPKWVGGVLSNDEEIST